MNGQQDNITQHNAAEIIRYLSGKMARDENHAFERAMVDDDLLADAVEGYQLMQDSMNDDQILGKAKLVSTRPAQKEENKAAVVSFARFRWVAYAAAAFLVVSAGWFIFNLTQRGTNLPGENESPAMVQKEMEQSENNLPTNPGDQDKVADLNPSDTSASKTTAKISDVPKAQPKKTGADELTKTPNLQTGPLQQKNDLKTTPTVGSLNLEDSAGGKPVTAKRNNLSNVKIDQATLLNVKVLDTTEAIPMAGWVTYKVFLGETLPKTVDNSVSRAIISIEAGGKISQVRLEGKLPASEKKTTENAILSGPGWKSKTGRPAKAIFEWQ